MKVFKFKIPYKLIKILTIVFATLLCIAVIGNQITSVYASTINKALNIPPSDLFKIVKKGDGDTDDIYFKSKYSENKIDDKGFVIYTQEGIDRLQKDAEQACIEIEGEGLVLLKNDKNALPLADKSNVSLFGQGSVVFNYGTSGSSATSTAGYADLKTALESVDINVNESLWNFYKTGEGKDYVRATKEGVYMINEAPWDLVNGNSGSFSSYGDAAIVVIARNSGEGSDVSAAGSDGANGNYLALSKNEEDMLKGLTGLKQNGTFKKIIVILNTSNPVQLDFLNNSSIDVDACMWVGNVGKTGIYAVARALNGEIVPSGRLSDTYVYDNFSSPAMASWAMNAEKKFAQSYSNAASYPSLNDTQINYGVYVEGIYVGYRYYETRYEDVVLGMSGAGNYDYKNVVAYPFGHGLSYAQFEYSGFAVTETEDTYEVSVTVTNTDENYAGKEVVQVYLQKPYAGRDNVETASVELAGFTKTGELAKNGGNETVSISISKEQLTTYDVNANGGKGGYVLEEGDYYISLGTNSHDALNNILAQKSADGKNVGMDKMTAAGKADNVYSWKLNSRDEVSYAASKETNNLITNQFDFADINRYENRGGNSVTYVSRSNWEGTMPKSAVTLSLTEGMVADLGIHKELPQSTDKMPTYNANAGMSLAMLRSTEENPVPYDSMAWETFLDQMTFEQQSELLANAAFGTVSFEAPFHKPATKDNDGPTGVVGSKTQTSFPSEGIWASSFNKELIKKTGEMLAEDALCNGFNSLYATGINIHRTPYGGRAHEYFSEDPYLTGVAVTYEVEGIQGKGVIPTLKHFAFNDEEHKRGGICIWLNEQEAREIMLKPFEMAMRPSMGNAHGIMTSFNRAGCIWTSASSELMINVSRKEWGFDGYSITDMAESFKFYMTYDDGIMNGTELYLASGDEYSLSEYGGSMPFRLRMREACHRVLYVICNYSAAMNGLSADSEVINLTPAWQMAIYAAIGVFAVLTASGAGLWIASYAIPLFKNKKKENENE